MIKPFLSFAIKIVAVSVPTIAAVIQYKKTRLLREFRKLKERFVNRVTGVWDHGGAYGYIEELQGGFFSGPCTEEDKAQLRSWVGSDSARRTLGQNRLDEDAYGEDDGLDEPEGDDVDEVGEGDGEVVRRVRRGGHRRAARNVYNRVVSSIGQRAYSTAQKLIVEDHARRELKALHVRACDIRKLLDEVVGMYFTPTESQLKLGALLKSKEFAAQRKMVDLEK